MANDKTRKFSSLIVDGVAQAPSRAMLRAVGFTDEDFGKSQIGIASTWSMVTPCNMHIDQLADEAAAGADEAGGSSPYLVGGNCGHVVSGRHRTGGVEGVVGVSGAVV